ncbi:peptidase M3 [Blastochloris tepida]|uniref:Peptidase M3 n=1 Tax=Blastochloris tepida TaxID=2233851 RepID=A0A348G4P0_9HYPH|nr:peptidase M3 [Blastochloris tepida]
MTNPDLSDPDHSESAPAPNPLIAAWSTPFGVPPFAEIRPEHFPPAFEAALEAHRAEIESLAADPAPPSFETTLLGLETSGRLLTRVAQVFFNLCGADTNPALQAIERDIAPRLAAHHAAIFTDARLFQRIDALEAGKDRLDAEAQRLLQRTRLAFIRAGARLDPAGKARMAEIVERLATLGTQFAQNLLADEAAWTLVLDTEDDRAGLPDFVIDAALRAGAERGHPGKAVITLSRSSIEPFLTFSARRDLRRQAYEAWTRRGEMGGATDNRALIAEMVALRLERARLLGYPTFAAYKLDDTMAKTPEAVRGLLEEVWAPAKARALRELCDLQRLAEQEGFNGTIAGWDWRHYAEKLRKARFDLDEAATKPYLPLDQVIAAAFDTASRLFGLVFTERTDVPVYHPDVRAFEVSRDGRHVALFLGDYFARPSKRSGAWMSSFRTQEKLAGDIRPIIVNVMNFAKGEPALLSFDDARTLFHEFGHALHGMLSDVTYPSLAGTDVATDFVELPSQLYEHWLSRPEVLGRFARHHATGQPMPEEMIARIKAAQTFNQGYATVEYVASALVDLAFHEMADTSNLDPLAFEAKELARIGMPAEISMRHRTPHFAHVFAGDGYSAGYYSYLWSEVLDADAFAAFEETGNVFDPATAERLSRFIYAAGNRRDPAEAYIAFRGRLPTTAALLKKRGLADAA